MVLSDNRSMFSWTLDNHSVLSYVCIRGTCALLRFITFLSFGCFSVFLDRVIELYIFTVGAILVTNALFFTERQVMRNNILKWQKCFGYPVLTSRRVHMIFLLYYPFFCKMLCFLNLIWNLL